MSTEAELHASSETCVVFMYMQMIRFFSLLKSKLSGMAFISAAFFKSLHRPFDSFESFMGSLFLCFQPMLVNFTDIFPFFL